MNKCQKRYNFISIYGKKMINHQLVIRKEQRKRKPKQINEIYRPYILSLFVHPLQWKSEGEAPP